MHLCCTFVQSFGMARFRLACTFARAPHLASRLMDSVFASSVAEKVARIVSGPRPTALSIPHSLRAATRHCPSFVVVHWSAAAVCRAVGGR